MAFSLKNSELNSNIVEIYPVPSIPNSLEIISKTRKRTKNWPSAPRQTRHLFAVAGTCRTLRLGTRARIRDRLAHQYPSIKSNSSEKIGKVRRMARYWCAKGAWCVFRQVEVSMAKVSPNGCFRTWNTNHSRNCSINCYFIFWITLAVSNEVLAGIQTSLLIKETAQNSTYLHPSSYHPKFIPIGILKGEFIRIRKLSSNETTYKNGINEIINKATQSEFPMVTINEVLDEAKTWDSNNRIEVLDIKPKDPKNKALVWVSQLPTCIKDRFSKNLRKFLPRKPKTSLQIA